MPSKLNVGAVCTHSVVFIREAIPLRTAAELMRQHHIGSLVVVRPTEAGNVVIGMLTDRDIVVAVVARDADPAFITASQAMTAGAVTVTESASLYDALEIMRRAGVRRLPVVNGDGVLTGLIALDDMLQLIVDELGMFVRAMRRAALHEQQDTSDWHHQTGQKPTGTAP